jgi:hypothetical protein
MRREKIIATCILGFGFQGQVRRRRDFRSEWLAYDMLDLLPGTQIRELLRRYVCLRRNNFIVAAAIPVSSDSCLFLLLFRGRIIIFVNN